MQRLALPLVLLVAMAGQAATLHESATFDPQIGSRNHTVSDVQFLGSRFSVASSVQVTAVGGDIVEDISGPVFAAIIPLASPTALPAFLPADLASFAVAGITFTPAAAFPHDDVSLPFSALLAAGDYALVFGGGTPGSPGPFGATGEASMSDRNAALPGASFFFSDFGPVWNDETPAVAGESKRFVVEGFFVPEPASGALVGLGLALLGLRRRARA